MKKQTILLAVALLTAGTLATGCSNDDAAVENPIQQTATDEMAFSATIAPKQTAAARTRSVNESGVTTWVSGEQIAVYYQKTDNSHGKATALFTVLVNGSYSSSIGVTTYGLNYVKISDDVTLDAGKFYTDVPITCKLAMEYSGTRTSTIELADGDIAILNGVSMNNFTGGLCIRMLVRTKIMAEPPPSSSGTTIASR